MIRNVIGKQLIILHVAVQLKVQILTPTHRHAYSGLQIDDIIGVIKSGRPSSLTKTVNCISTSDGRKKVWCRRGKWYSDNCVVKRDSWGEPSIRELFRKLGPVVFLNFIGPNRGNGVTASKYIDQVPILCNIRTKCPDMTIPMHTQL